MGTFIALFTPYTMFPAKIQIAWLNKCNIPGEKIQVRPWLINSPGDWRINPMGMPGSLINLKNSGTLPMTYHMSQQLFFSKDLSEIKRMGLSPERVLEQLQKFKKGARFTRLMRPATVSDGISRLSKSQKDLFVQAFEKAKSNRLLVKFLPASGAATRMFSVPLYFLNHPPELEELGTCASQNPGSAEKKFMRIFFRGIRKNKFPFSKELRDILTRKNLNLDRALKPGNSRTLLEYMLTEIGLNYANLPKALIPFHSYGVKSRTPVEEHLVESREYLRGRDDLIRIHLTISRESTGIFKNFIDSVIPQYQTHDRNYQVTYSIQDPSTCTVAVDRKNNLLRDRRNRIVFRQGGHGALLENLNRLNEDIIFISNIDNVVPDRLKPRVIFYKKVLAGYLSVLQNRIFEFLNQMAIQPPGPETFHTIQSFCQKEKLISFPENFRKWKSKKKANFLFKKLNRPIRVCGMVINQGEPGGGPFWVRDKMNRESLQIVEKAQINLDSDEQSRILSASTHFNPVDLVCGIKDFRGEKFNLSDFSDPDAYFLTEKSLEGRPVKALELPGLWNGGMANWITRFVEVPILTFNPVKTVNDLLKPRHQPAVKD